MKKALQSEEFANKKYENLDEVWKLLMLEPKDYGYEAIKDPFTRKLMDKMTFEHGGKEYDDKYPDGIPTSVQIELKGN